MMTVADFPRYHYRAEVVRVLDGDTIEVTIDCGFRVAHTIHIRIAGINTPEIRGAERMAGLNSRGGLCQLLSGRNLYVHTHKDGRSFARYVADCYVDEEDGELIDVAAEMVARGHAVRVEG